MKFWWFSSPAPSSPWGEQVERLKKATELVQAHGPWIEGYWENPRITREAMATMVQANETTLAPAMLAFKAIPDTAFNQANDWNLQSYDISICFQKIINALNMNWSSFYFKKDYGNCLLISILFFDLFNHKIKNGFILDIIQSGSYFGGFIFGFQKNNKNINGHQFPMLLNCFRCQILNFPNFDYIYDRDRRHSKENFKYNLEELKKERKKGLISREFYRSRLDDMKSDFSPVHITQFRLIYQQIVTLWRLFIVDLALWGHKMEKGFWPGSLMEMDCWGADEVHIDPFSKKPFCYRLDPEQGYLLYSTGPEGIDHGGRLGSWSKVKKGGHDLGLNCWDLGSKECDEIADLPVGQSAQANPPG